MTHQPEERGPRKFVRVEVTLQVKFVCLEDMQAMINASTIDISRGGMFIRSATSRKVGQSVRVQLPGPNGRGIEIQGVIRHVRYNQGQPDGFGVEFAGLSDDARLIIEQLLQSTGKTSPP